MNLYEVGLLALIVITETGAQTLLEGYVKAGFTTFSLYLGMILYFTIGYLYYQLLKVEKSLAVANILWNGGTTLTITAVSYFYFKQELSRRQFIGLLITIVGIFLLA